MNFSIIDFIWGTIVSLPLWATILWIIYAIYFTYRACQIWIATDEMGIVKGYGYVFLGYNQRTLRLYHLLRMIIDIPPAILGLLFPLLQKIFSLKIYEFKEKKKEE